MDASDIIIVVTVHMYLPSSLNSGKAGLFLLCILLCSLTGSQMVRFMALICHFVVSVVIVHISQKCIRD